MIVWIGCYRRMDSRLPSLKSMKTKGLSKITIPISWDTSHAGIKLAPKMVGAAKRLLLQYECTPINNIMPECITNDAKGAIVSVSQSQMIHMRRESHIASKNGAI